MSLPTSFPPLKRLFVAIELPRIVTRSLLQVQRPCKGFRWSPEDNLHLTLKFIGDVDTALENEIKRVLSNISVDPFFLPVEGLGRFPAKGQPHVLWTGLERGHPRLFQLKHRLEDALFQIGIEPDSRVYSPHITLARTSDAAPATVDQFIKANRDFGAPPFRVEHFTLFSSHHSNEGMIYKFEDLWQLEERKVV